jgi:hypothetical protein
MTKLVLTAVLLAATASSALAQQSIGIYEDETALDCEISDPGGGVSRTFYIVHTNQVQPAIGSAWRLEWDPGMTMVWMGDASPFFKLGDAQNGARIAYSVCTYGTFMIDAVTMMSFGTSAPCSYLRLGPDPTQGRVIIFCNFVSVPFAAGEAIVNANSGCTCSVSTEQTTWGTVKALYR